MSASAGTGRHAESVSVIEGYRRWAPTYDADPNPMLALEERHVTASLPDITGKNVLDLACGTGRWTRILTSRQPATVVGLDISAAMLGVIRARGAQHILRADCCRLPLGAERFDFAICSFAASHIVELDVLASECARVLKPNADLFLTDLHPDAHQEGWRTGFRDNGGVAEITTVERSNALILNTFYASGFECAAARDLYFSEAEREIFFRAGKSGYFAAACRIPAVLLCHFRRVP